MNPNHVLCLAVICGRLYKARRKFSFNGAHLQTTSTCIQPFQKIYPALLTRDIVIT